ncbi:hypothetical protein ABH922_003023 [Rhodococcus sp. 27YEA15]|uniref:hypothetical protein n=1 Tax=Rhodococcus sp. 27YEA15 TaxID=3156259 RepID=UPI003C7C3726
MSGTDFDPDLVEDLALWRHDAAQSRALDIDTLHPTLAWDALTEDQREVSRAGIREVLRMLEVTGRLAPAGGLALTAEQVEAQRVNLELLSGCIIPEGGMGFTAALVEDVRTVVNADWDHDTEWWGPRDRLRALFPATEPAEERRSFPAIQDVPNNTLLHTHGGEGSSLFVRNRFRELRLSLGASKYWSKPMAESDFLPSSGPYVEVPWSKFPQPWADPFALPAPAEPAEDVAGNPLQAWESVKKSKVPASEQVRGSIWEGLVDAAVEAGVGLHDWDMVADQGDPAEAAAEAIREAIAHLGLWPASEQVSGNSCTECNSSSAPFDASARADKAPTAEAEETKAALYAAQAKLTSIEMACDRVGEGIYTSDIYDILRTSTPPVTPAPAETEWQTWDAVPEGVKYRSEGDPRSGYFVNHGGIIYLASGRPSTVSEFAMQELAPFVAAPAETKWQTWDAVPEGVKYRSEGDPRSGYFVNHGGIIYLASGRPSTVSEFAMQELAPFVAAPAETKWQGISEAPKHLTLIDRAGDKWTYDGDNWVTPETAILPVLYINRKYAPFVAAKEGKA